MNRLSMVGVFAVRAAIGGGGYWFWQKSEAEDAKKGAVVAAGKDGKEAQGGKGGKDGKEAKGKGKGPAARPARKSRYCGCQPVRAIVRAGEQRRDALPRGAGRPEKMGAARPSCAAKYW